MSTWVKMYLKATLFMLGIALIFSGEFGLSFDGLRYYLVFLVVGVCLLLTTAFWWYKDFKRK